MRRSAPFPGERQCPCGSGRAYKACCKRRNIQYNINNNGQVFQVDTIDDTPSGRDIHSSLQDAKVEFLDIFGRQPVGNDPLILETYLYSEEDFERQTHEVLDRLEGVPPEIIYATKKTGRFVTAKNYKKIPKIAIKEWNDAIDEYRSGNFKAISIPKNYYKDMLKNIYYSICHLGSCINKFPKNISLDGTTFSQYYIMSRNLDILRLQHKLFKDSYTELNYALVRNSYENYLRLIFLRKKPEFCVSFMSQISVASGNYLHPIKSDGKPNYKRLVDIDTGVMYRNDYSNYEMAISSELPEDVDLYRSAYPALSTYVHPGIEESFRHFDFENGFAIHPYREPIAASIIVNMVSALIFDEVRKIDGITSLVRKDALYIATKLKNSILDANKNLEDAKKTGIYNAFLPRLNLVGLI